MNTANAIQVIPKAIRTDAVNVTSSQRNLPNNKAFAADAILDVDSSFNDPATSVEIIIEELVGSNWEQRGYCNAKGGDQNSSKNGIIACGYSYDPASGNPPPGVFRVRTNCIGTVNYGVKVVVE